MNRQILDAYCDLHRTVMEDLKTRVPAEIESIFKRKMTLSEIKIDGEGCITAEYTRYMGCGESEREYVIIDPYKLFKETT
jgi:hypothetical protein